MGLIQRAVEAIGIPTISISLSLNISRKILPPRALFNGFPLGHPLGHPGQVDLQLEILRSLLKCLVAASAAGTIVERYWHQDKDFLQAPPDRRS